MKFTSLTTQIKSIQLYFPVVMFITPYNAVLTLKFLDIIIKCDHSYENFCSEFAYNTAY